jgi:DNA processing protein
MHFDVTEKFPEIVIDTQNSAYPDMLLQIIDPPEQLYCMGDPTVLRRPCIGIVGARRCTEYGKWAAFEIAKGLSVAGITVVSGMAEGVDTYAHNGAIAGGTPTIAVLGCGTDICYPAGNRKLRGEILETGGAVISEFSRGTMPERWRFPRRNRIISGLSAAVAVAEAGLQSGSLITATLAAEQGREVYAVPGNINRKTSIGCNKLIKDGANILMNAADILRDFGIESHPDKKVTEQLGADEKELLKILKREGELTLNQLSHLSKKPISVVTATVSILEIKGAVSYDAGRVFNRS